MASKIKVDTLETANGSGTIALSNQLSGMTTASLPALGSAQMPAGSVVQVLIDEDSSSMQLQSSTYTDTDLSISITPSSTSSKILALWNVQGNLNQSTSGWGTRLVRDSTNVFTSNQQYAQYASTFTSQRQSADYKHIDSPNTTSTITYKVQVSTYQNTSVYFNDDTAQTQLVLMEIKG